MSAARLAPLAALVLAGCADVARLAGDLLPAPPAAVQWADAVPYLVQHECPDGRLPVEGCTDPVPARAGPLAYRRLDWSGAQASDAVLRGDGGALLTFDFGDAPRAFGRHDIGQGDGADAVQLDRGGISIAVTEDGGAGLQFWLGSPCPGPAGWLLWATPPSAEWQSSVARIRRGDTATDCSRGLGAAFTRWRLEPDHALPWRSDNGRSGVWRGPAVVTEHYSHATIDGSDHLERMAFARHLGRVRWERWERAPDQARVAGLRDGRCPDPQPPPPGAWELADCRVWSAYRTGAGQTSMPWSEAR